MVKIIANQDGKVLGSNNGTKAYTAPAPTGTISITENGNYNVEDYASANVNVIDEGLAKRISGTYGSYTLLVPDNITNLKTSAFQSDEDITEIDLNNVTDVGSSCFRYCSNLTKITTTKLQTTGQYAFSDCALINFKVPNTVTNIYSRTFNNNKNLEIVDLTEFDSSVSGFRVPYLQSYNAFGTGKTTGKTYLCFKDQATLQAFKSATNWSAIETNYNYVEFRVGLPN